jgi:hypothetical protein
MYEAKDLMRIQDIDSNGNTMDQKLGLANKMANLIKDREKAYRRYEAALDHFGAGHPVTEVFLRRWHILNGVGLMNPVPVAPPKVEVEKVKANSPVEEAFFGSTLPEAGTLNPEEVRTRKGTTKGTIEIWETWTKDIIHIVNKGDQPVARIGSIANIEDEVGNYLFGGRMLDWTNSKPAAEKKYGKAVETRVYA